MREGDIPSFGDAVLEVITRRIRLVTLVVLVGGVYLIATHEPSWNGMITMAAVVSAAALLLALAALRTRARHDAARRQSGS